MSAGEITLLVIGGVALAESSWGLTAPNTLKNVVEAATREVPERNPGLAVVFGGLACLLWLLMTPERTIADYALLGISWVFAGGALVNLTPGGFTRLMRIVILDRPAWAIRLFYAGEFVVACSLIAIGIGAG